MPMPHPTPVVATARMEFEVHLRLTEGEARTLWAMFCYGHEELRKKCLEMGTHYMTEADERGIYIEALAAKIYGPPLNSQLARIDAARAAFDKKPDA